MKRSAISDILFLLLKLLILLLLVGSVIFFSLHLIQGYLSEVEGHGQEGFHSGYGLLLFASVILSAAVNGVALILSLLGITISAFRTSLPNRASHLSAFTRLAIASPIAEGLIIAIGIVIALLIGRLP